MAVDLVRDTAIHILMGVLLHNKHVDVSIDRKLRRGKYSPQGSRFLTHLVYGVVRHKTLCDYVLSDLCSQPLDELPIAVLMILRMGVFQQLFCDNVTRPAMVHTSVDLAKRHSHPGLARLVNAVLRRVPDSLEQLVLPDKDTDLVEFLRVRYSTPRWMIRLWIQLFGEVEAERFCEICSRPAPLTLRVNTRVTTRDAAAEALTKSGVSVSVVHEDFEALQVEGGVDPLKTQWFKEGHFMVQNPASMLPSRLTCVEAGQTILDMCAAPGGKTTHLAALSNDEARLIALERFPTRVGKIEENCLRLGIHSVQALCGDGLTPPFKAESFDTIIVDAPCSGLGTLRRHPEIKWRSGPDSILELAEIQRAMLRKAVQLCKNGGLIVYSVCTLTPEETVDVVSEIVGDGVCMPEDGPELFNSWKTRTGQYQTNPLDAAWDGFFLTRFRKQS
ncbi:MAG: 16S rRNA (cytosine(967)-C(5))-methyltransferase RsmB [Candidatus Hydrogenedentales bacterium]